MILDALVEPNRPPAVVKSPDGSSPEGGQEATAAPPPGEADVWSGEDWARLCDANFQQACARPEVTPPPAAPGAPATVTLRDIASFRPAKPGNEMQPGGWAVAGLPANFVAEASAEVVAGTLLGRPAEVRFTPVGYRWVHSDGVTVTSPTAGATWEQLGLREFSPTGTSHVYAEPGEYTVTLEVALAAEYRFGGSAWQGIAGTLAVAGPPQPVLVGEVDTVLTKDDCRANPAGPGC
ncbi:PKD domain-containing protein [Agromyces sp. NPDC058104]|uniref:PKD domain-containing protein n=1 Tax=Agromyces sp. NPDC058104 TaxID=3346342 RepID=UPI0036DB189D